MTIYKFEFRDLQDTLTCEAYELYDIEYNFVLNDVGTARFKVKKDSIPYLKNFIIPERSQLWIYREDEHIWTGIIKDQNKNYATEEISFTAETYESFLEERYIDYWYVSSDTNKAKLFTDFVWDSMTKGSYSQTGITIGNIGQGQTSFIKEGEEFSNITLLKAGKRLAETVHGFDFLISPKHVLSTYSPKKGEIKENIVLELGKNIKNIQERITGNKVINRSKYIGENGIVYIVDDLGSQEVYKVRERITKLRDVVSEELIKDLAEEEVLKKGTVQLNYDIELAKKPVDIDISKFSVGDYIKIVAKSENDNFNIDMLKRVEEITVKLDNEYNETLDLIFFEE